MSVLLLLIAVIFAFALVKLKNNLSQPQFWSILLIVIVCVLFAFFSNKKHGSSYSSNDWFKLIIEKLEDNDTARIFLREFQHPDDFHDKHREQLKTIMELLKQKISNGADIKIIAYHPNGKKNGLKWLESELSDNKSAIQNLYKMIKIIKKQPNGSNSSSAYIFSDKSVLFNQRIDGKVLYYYNNLTNSILFSFISKGYDFIGDNNE